MALNYMDNWWSQQRSRVSASTTDSDAQNPSEPPPTASRAASGPPSVRSEAAPSNSPSARIKRLNRYDPSMRGHLIELFLMCQL